ncbi:DNA-binding transcriptional regulator [Mesorhizobium loti]|nr:YafY family protein [Mesorhizobium loti]PLP59189.1 DNA-binding transcriptional regulator [Mesorhizobium loti]
MRTLRLFELLDCLRSATAPVSAEELARKLEVSPRTIYRDMATLQAMGAPVRGESGLGYQLEKGYFLPPLHFDEDEMEAIMLGVHLVMARGDTTLASAAHRVSGKLGSTMHSQAELHYRNLPLRAYYRKTMEIDQANKLLPLMRRSIRKRMMLAVDYTDLSGKESRERLVRPLGLTLFDAVWLLTAWCEARNAFRNFRLDRIGKAEVTGTTFKNEKGKRFQDYLDALPS